MSAPNVLANRYASSQMRAIWGQENKIIAERRLWITIMEAQACLLYTSPSPRDRG